MLFELYNKLSTELIAIVSSTVPNLIFVVGNITFICIGMLFAKFLLFVLVELGLECIVLKRIVGWYFLRISRSMRWVRLNELFYLLLELCFSLIYWDSFCRNLAWINRYVWWWVVVICWWSCIQLVYSVFLKDRQL